MTRPVWLVVALAAAAATLPACRTLHQHALVPPVHLVPRGAIAPTASSPADVVPLRARFLLETSARLGELDADAVNLRSDVEAGIRTAPMTTLAALDEARAVARASLARAGQATEEEWPRLARWTGDRLASVADAYQRAFARSR